MFQKGKTKQINGDQYIFGRSLGRGGYGEVWAARRCSDDVPLVIKRFHKVDDNDIWRMEALRELRLTNRLAGAASASEVIHPRGNRQWAGYVMPWAAGIGLDQWLEKEEVNVLDDVLIAIQIAKILADTHQLDVAHGDMHPRNVKVYVHNDVPVVTLIDWDNAVIPDVPSPRSPGAKHFFSPESMEAWVKEDNRPPDIRTECSSATKIFHWLVFRRAAFHTEDESEFEKETINGSWNSDPAEGPIDSHNLGGIPNQWVSSEIANLFRRGLGCDRGNRPSMDEWQSAFLHVVDEGIPLCQTCSGPVLVAPRTHCPYCNNPFPTLAVVSASGQRFVANCKPVLIGRDAISSPGVSQRHAVITKLGPETYITDLSSKNGTYRLAGDRWIRLPARQRSPIQKGDRFRCGNVELTVVTE